MDDEPIRFQGHRKGYDRPAHDEIKPAEPDSNLHPGKSKNIFPHPGLAILICFIVVLVIVISIIVYLATGPHSMNPLLP